jgi:hypothetical protein
MEREDHRRRTHTGRIGGEHLGLSMEAVGRWQAERNFTMRTF